TFSAAADPKEQEEATKRKKAVIRTFSIGAGIVLASVLHIHIVKTLDPSLPSIADYVDILVSGLVISLGTDGINQIVKFVEQAKNNQEADADKKDAQKKQLLALEPQMDNSQIRDAAKKVLQP